MKVGLLQNLISKSYKQEKDHSLPQGTRERGWRMSVVGKKNREDSEEGEKGEERAIKSRQHASRNSSHCHQSCLKKQTHCIRELAMKTKLKP